MIYYFSITTSDYRQERSISCRKLFLMLAVLARNLIFNTWAKAIEFIKQIITSSDFIASQRFNPNDFTQKRKPSFHVLVIFLINFVRGSYQDELDKFFKTICRFDVAKRIVSKAALNKARMKIKFEAFVELNLYLVLYFERHFKLRKWYGFRLLAIDGSTTRLPMTESIAQHFGVRNGRQGAPSPMARVPQLFDVLNKISVDALIKPKSAGERELAAQHMINVMGNDLILLDKGYPAWWLFNLILSMDAQLCASISCTKWKVVRKFFRSGLPEKIIDLPIHPTSVAKCRQMGLDTTSLKLRLVCIEKNESVTALATSLIDTQQYPIDIFNDLYHDRWPIEEDYSRIELENFSGKSALSIHQDFLAKVFDKNLVWIMAFSVQDRIGQDSCVKKHRYQINLTQAFLKSKGVISLLFHDASSRSMHLIADLQSIHV